MRFLRSIGEWTIIALGFAGLAVAVVIGAVGFLLFLIVGGVAAMLARHGWAALIAAAIIGAAWIMSRRVS